MITQKMASKFFLNFILIFSSCLFVGFSEITPQSLNNALTQASGTVGGLLHGAADDINNGDLGPSMQCVQKLLPCQPYLHSPAQPPATCCVPLAEMVQNETQCLCGVIDNPAILQSLNITKDGALNLAKSCGTKADLSRCKNATSPASTPATPSPSPPTSPASSNGSSTASSPPKSAAYRNFHSGRSAFIVTFIMGLIFLAF